MIQQNWFLNRRAKERQAKKLAAYEADQALESLAHGDGSLFIYGPNAAVKCSICSATFSNAQDFYSHLDDCVLRIVEQEGPSETLKYNKTKSIHASQQVATTSQSDSAAEKSFNRAEVFNHHLMSTPEVGCIHKQIPDFWNDSTGALVS
jgi:hypothetical protein